MNHLRWLPILPVLLVAACSGSPASPGTGSPTPISSCTPVGTATPTPSPTGTTASGDTVGPDGGTVSQLSFAITGDSRPSTADDTANYPSAIVQQIWQSIEGESVPFALATGDYVNATATGVEASAQLDLYLAGRAAFQGTVFPTLGNHECQTHVDTANCGNGNPDGVTNNFSAFVTKMLGPLGITTPNYTFRVDAKDGTWTSKFVVVSGNSWSSADSTWLDETLSVATTYRFIVRHQDVTGNDAPGVLASAPIMANHPYTLLLCAHTHTFSFDPANQQVITGNGGAPLSGSVNYGYTVIRRQADGTLLGTNYDYQTHAAQGTFHVNPDGTVAP